jgi:hypothetical protein
LVDFKRVIFLGCKQRLEFELYRISEREEVLQLCFIYIECELIVVEAVLDGVAVLVYVSKVACIRFPDQRRTGR